MMIYLDYSSMTLGECGLNENKRYIVSIMVT